jgi:uncharacterized membrane protein YeiH
MISAMDILYLLGLLASGAFAASGILAAMGTRIDLFGAVVVAIVTALGGGTLRDLMLDAPIFWLHDPAFMICAALTGAIASSAARIWMRMAIYSPVWMRWAWRCSPPAPSSRAPSWGYRRRMRWRWA